MKKELFGEFEGQDIFVYTLTNGILEAEVITYGGTLRTLRVPDASGKLVDVILGYDDLAGFTDNSGCLGALIGRFGNRIEFGRFTLNSVEYQIPATNNGNALHGGLRGFNKRIWRAEPISDSELALYYTAADGEEGFPGTLTVEVHYLLKENALRITYDAVCDADTIINLTNHAYFNLNGEGDILGHQLQLLASNVTPVDDKLIPHGELLDVAGTPFDFRTAKPIGRDIAADHFLIHNCMGYDTNFCIDGTGWRKFVESKGDGSGIRMVGYTDQPGVQLYTGNMLHGQKGKVGYYTPHAGFCLETQNYPNAINCPNYPSPVLKKGERYHTVTEFAFFTE